MGIKTEQMVKYLPPKEITENVDWLGVLDSFDPSKLNQRFVDECARRNPFDTCYRWDTPVRPVEYRLESSETYAKFDRDRLIDCVKRIESEGLTPTTYKNARAALIKAIGGKGAVEYNRREYERLGEDGRKAQVDAYLRWKEECEEIRRREESAADCGIRYYDEYIPASVHEKVVKIRKGFKGSNGKPLIQRDFAKLLEYPINKYAEAEKVDRYVRWDEETPVDDELLEKLVIIAHANPYWLFDSNCEADYSEWDFNHNAVQMGDEPCVYATPDVILKWILEGKPKETNWEDGILWEYEWEA